MSVNWDHLRFFLALANTGSMTLAARELGVSHTTVLRRVRAIEKELETHLFDHTMQGHVLTPAGDSLHAEVQKVKYAVDNISRQISGVDQLIEGAVVITTTDTLGYCFMPSIVTRLHQRHPELSITLKVANRMSDISNREADIALRTCVAPPENLIGRKVGTIRFAACASQSYVEQHEISRFPDETAEHRFVVLDASFKEVPFYCWLAERISENYVTVNGLLTAYHLCVAGAGITVLPTYLINASAGLVELPAIEPVASNDLWLLSHVDLRDTLRIKLVKRFLLDELQRSLG